MRKKINRKLKSKHFHVTIFGSSRVKEHDKVYKEIYSLAKMLGEKNIDVITGGGPGIMKAANSGHQDGAKKNDSHSIGLGIKLPREQKFNPSVQLYDIFDKFSSRLDNFMLFSNVIIVAPGGIGTTLELFYTWQLLQVKHISSIPLILLGEDYWMPMIKWMEKFMLKNRYIDKKDLNLIFVAKNSKEAMRVIDKAYDEYKNGCKNFCKMHKEYKI